MYDSNSIRIPTAVKGIWLLFKRARWEQLRQLGMRRSEVESVLEAFDSMKVGARPDLSGRRQVEALMKAYPPIIDAAVRLTGVYMIAYKEEIQWNRPN